MGGEPIVCEAADAHVASLHDLPDVLPELFAAVHMKVTNQKSANLYITAAKRFLQGSVDEDGNARAPVHTLRISGLGEAISTAVVAATAVEKSGLGKIQKLETSYADMHRGSVHYGTARIEITVSSTAPKV